MLIIKLLFPVYYYNKQKLNSSQIEIMNRLCSHLTEEQRYKIEYRAKSNNSILYIDSIVQTFSIISLIAITIILISTLLIYILLIN